MVGDLAPDFDVERLAGKGHGDRLRSADLRGQLVLLDFWATWCGPCVVELPTIKDIHKTYGDHPRFRIISLSLDETAEPAIRMIREKGLVWSHGLSGKFGTEATASFDVQTIPATYLIGPDGRILAKDLRGAELKAAVGRALASIDKNPGVSK